MKTSEIIIRDPFILPCRKENLYYMYGTTALSMGYPTTGFYYYKSHDLQEWDGPFESFIPESNFWADKDFWAPEVHEYKGRYYMFASFKCNSSCRGTQILVADSPGSRFKPLTDGPVTPRDWECLDGTLYVENGIPYIVFCHEWVQIKDGEIVAMPLTEDLKYAAGKPQTLFKSSDSLWSSEYPGAGNYVTDGPFLFREDDVLKMFWSSFHNGNYAVGCAYSEGGTISGPWKHEKELLFITNGGHGMRFEDFSGKKYFVLHHPNIPDEHPFIFEMPCK